MLSSGSGLLRGKREIIEEGHLHPMLHLRVLDLRWTMRSKDT
jgi:hypothetical protein